MQKSSKFTRHEQDKPLRLQSWYARYECYMQLLPTKYLLAKDFYCRSYIKIQVMASCNKTCKVHRTKNILDAFSLQSKIKSLFYIYYLCSSKSRGAEVFKIRLASSLRNISQSCIFSLYKSYKDYL